MVYASTPQEVTTAIVKMATNSKRIQSYSVKVREKVLHLRPCKNETELRGILLGIKYEKIASCPLVDH